MEIVKVFDIKQKFDQKLPHKSPIEEVTSITK